MSTFTFIFQINVGFIIMAVVIMRKHSKKKSQRRKMSIIK